MEELSIITTYSAFILRLIVATGGGMIIGFERKWHNKAAGLRTNTLVAIGAALFVMLSLKMIAQSPGDITRVIGQVVTGMGFLGGGIIFKEGVNVRGLTTAATVWCSAAVGCFAGAGFLIESLIAVVTILSINTILIPIDSWLGRRNKRNLSKKLNDE